MIARASDPEIPHEDRLIYALDGMNRNEAILSVRTLGDVIRIFKIGPALIYEGGLRIAQELANAANGGNVRVFLDMKTWDIPETVLNALKAIGALKEGGETVVFATIHTFSLNLRKLVEAKKDFNFRIFAITLLTSQDQTDLRELRIDSSVEDYVLHMARRAQEFGCDGVIASGHEVRRIKAELGPGFRVITPGIRPATASVPGDDQKRVVTPKQAILNGADHIVVGRPIRMAPDPVAAAHSIRREIEEALAERGEDPEPDRPDSPRMKATG